MTVSLVIQDFEALAQSGAYGGLRRLSPQTELMLISLYQYESLYRWRNANGQSLTDEQIDTIDVWTANAQYELQEEVAEVPIGSVLPFVGTVVPDNAIICNGATRNRVDWPELYAVLPANLIVDADKFRVPNMNASFPRGAVTDSFVGLDGGSSSFTLTVAQLPPHTHNYTSYTNTTFAEVGPGPLVPDFVNTAPLATTSTGSGAPVTHIPRFVNFKYIIIAR